jgi:predicted ATPase
MSVADFEAARGMTFFDRGVVDAAVAVTASRSEHPTSILKLCQYDLVFLAPPWPEIYVQDVDRRHSLEKALTDFDRVRLAYSMASYEPILLPRGTVAARADFVLAHLPGWGERLRSASRQTR